MVKVKCIQRFNDVTQPVWEVTEERAKHLVAEGVVEIVTEKTTTAKALEK